MNDTHKHNLKLQDSLSVLGRLLDELEDLVSDSDKDITHQLAESQSDYLSRKKLSTQQKQSLNV